MSDAPNDDDLLIAKISAMEVMLLTLIRPLAANPKFWGEANAIVEAFERANQDAIAAFPHRWPATRRFIEEWRKALNPSQQA